MTVRANPIAFGMKSMWALALPFVAACGIKQQASESKETPFVPYTPGAMPAQIPDEAWDEVVRIGGGDPTKVIVFNSDGVTAALNIDKPQDVWTLDDPNWAGYHKCMEKREYRNKTQDLELYVACTIKKDRCRGTLEVWARDARWSNGDSKLVKNERFTKFAGIDTDTHLAGYPLTFDPSHSPAGNYAAVVSNERGIVTKQYVDDDPESGIYMDRGGWEELWIISTDHVRDWDNTRKIRVTEQDGYYNQKHPSFSPNGQHIIFSTNKGTGNYHLEMLKNPLEDHTSNRDRYHFKPITGKNFDAQMPVWVKYRDLPQGDSECRTALGL